MSEVFFSEFRFSSEDNIFSKTRKLAEKVRLAERIKANDLVAIKAHFGEYGNLAFIPPPIFKVITDIAREKGAKPFITDTNTLYRGMRSNAVDHHRNALLNGFSQEATGAPVIIADGLRGNDYKGIPLNSKYFNDIKIAGAIADADTVIVMSHVKGHELYGFGGALKNIAMGCVPPSAKQAIHSDLKPGVKEKNCRSCGMCIERCPVDAIAFNQGNKAEINTDVCIGCGECTVICPYDAIPIRWKTNEKPLFERSGDYIKGIMDFKPDNWIFFNYIINVSPHCDCFYWNDLAIVPDIGILASFDPVAIDRASVDLINSAEPVPRSKIAGKNTEVDNIKALFGTEWEYFFSYAEKIGIGNNRYNLIEI